MRTTDTLGRPLPSGGIRVRVTFDPQKTSGFTQPHTAILWLDRGTWSDDDCWYPDAWIASWEPLTPAEAS